MSKRTIKEDSAAADTYAQYTAAPSRAEVLQSITQAILNAPKEDLSGFYQQMIAQIGNEGDEAGLGNNAQFNQASIAMKPSAAIAEDLDAIFGDMQLSEDFKQKTATVFEAYVESRVAIREAELQEEFNSAVKAETASLMEDVTSKVDEYLSYVAEQWVEKNEIAINQSLKIGIMESFMNDLGKLYEKHNINIVHEEIDVVDSLATRVCELEEALNQYKNNEFALVKENKELIKKLAIEEQTVGLSLVKADKLRQLAETVDLDAKFFSTLQQLKESVNPKSAPTNILQEEIAYVPSKTSLIAESDSSYASEMAKAITKSIPNHR